MTCICTHSTATPVLYSPVPPSYYLPVDSVSRARVECSGQPAGRRSFRAAVGRGIEMRWRWGGADEQCMAVMME